MDKFNVNSLFSVQDYNVVITGGGTGIGGSMARGLAANGATVFVLGRRIEPLEETAKEVAAAGVRGTIVPVVCDVTSKDSLQAAARKVGEKVTHVDALIASSGATGPALPFPTAPSGPSVQALCDELWKTPMEDFTDTYNTNVTAVLYTAVAFLPLLYAANSEAVRGPGSSGRPRPQIIGVSSIASYAKGTASGYAYNSSKAALNQMLKQLGNLLVPYDVRSNVFCAGIWLTPMTQGTTLTDAAGGNDPVIEGAYPREIVPATRIGGETDAAGMILWLCSKAGSFVNGSVIMSDGGALSIRPSSY